MPPQSSFPAPRLEQRPGLAFGGDYNPEQWPVESGWRTSAS